MQCIPVILLSAVIIGAILCSACIDPSGPPKTVYTPNVSQTELRVDYTGPVSANYGTYDCIAREEVTAPWVLQFSTFNCRMVYASFGKVRNDTGTSVLTANLVRDGQIIKSYSTTTSAVRFEKIPEFLVRSSQEPNLVQGTPLTAKIIAGGEWYASVTDAFGYQSDTGSGSGTLTLFQPVLPVTACVRSEDNTSAVPPAVELYNGGMFLKRSGNTKDTYNGYCVTYP